MQHVFKYFISFFLSFVGRIFGESFFGSLTHWELIYGLFHAVAVRANKLNLMHWRRPYPAVRTVRPEVAATTTSLHSVCVCVCAQ